MFSSATAWKEYGSDGHPETGNRPAFRREGGARHKLAALPFPEKVRAVVCLQEMAAPVLRARGIKVCVWNLDDRVA